MRGKQIIEYIAINISVVQYLTKSNKNITTCLNGRKRQFTIHLRISASCKNLKRTIMHQWVKKSGLSQDGV